MPYIILTFVGDYPVEGQPNWSKEYSSISEAIKPATDQHFALKEIENDEHYTIIMDDDKDEEDDVVFLLYKGVAYRDSKAQELADTLAYGECP
jgi:hypothetical protein